MKILHMVLSVLATLLLIAAGSAVFIATKSGRPYDERTYLLSLATLAMLSSYYIWNMIKKDIPTGIKEQEKK